MKFLFPALPLSLVFTSVTFGLQAKDNSTVNATDKKAIEVIEVTAQKRAQNIQEVPVSITAISPSNIENIGYRQLDEITEFVPNMNMTITNDFTSIISLRGVGAASRNIGFDSRVGLYLDGVYLGQSPANNQNIYDLERIEVLRGPQGTLFGKNNVAGAISLLSKAPEMDFFGHVGITSGNLGLFQYQGLVNIPIAEKFAFKGSFNAYERDGLTENIATGSYINEQDNQSYRVQFLGELTDNLSVQLAIDELESERLSFDGEPITDTLGNAINTEAPQRNKVSFNIDPHEKRDIGGQILTIDWLLENGYQVKSITGNRDNKIEYINDFDFSNQAYAFLDYIDEYEQFSQEFQWISPVGKFQYVAGLYYYKQDAYTNRQTTAQPDIVELFTGIDRALLEQGAAFGDPRAIATLAAFNPGVLTTKGTVDTTSYAAFFNSSYQFNNTMSIDLGFRYSDEEKAVDWAISSIDSTTGYPVVPALGLANGEVKDTNSYHDFSPLIAVNAKLSKQINAYAKYATGYKSGGYNVDFLTQDQLDAGIAFDKETVESIEFGLKGYALEQDLMFRAALFFSKYDDYQVNQLVKLDSGTTAMSVRNAAKVNTQGLELEMTYAWNNHQLFANLALLDGEFDEFKNGGVNGEDLSGKSLPDTSDYSFNIGIQSDYHLAFINSDINIGMNYAYRDDYNTDLDGATQVELMNGDVIPVGAIDGYGVLNAKLELTPVGSDFNISLWAKNIADEDTPVVLGKKSFFGARRNIYLEPKTYGISAKYSF